MVSSVITPSATTREQAITDLIESIALQEKALSEILNAEGEKMKAIVGMEGITFEELLNMNKSVERLVNSVTRLEMILQSKLDLFDLTESNTTATSVTNK